MSRAFTLKVTKPEFLKFFRSVDSFQKTDRNLGYGFPEIREIPALPEGVTGLTLREVFHLSGLPELQFVVVDLDRTLPRLIPERLAGSEPVELEVRDTGTIPEGAFEVGTRALPEAEPLIDLKGILRGLGKQKVRVQSEIERGN